MRINLSEIEKRIIKKHDPAVRRRALLELEILSALLIALRGRDYQVVVEGERTNQAKQTVDDLKQTLFDLDDATLIVYKDGEKVGWIRLVFGNNGYDLVSDYTTNLEDVLRPVNKLADFWGRA